MDEINIEVKQTPEQRAATMAFARKVATEQLVKHMTNRFLAWRFPENFNPDGGISFTRPNYAPEVDGRPSGTNLLSATQAEAMFRYLLEDLPTDV